MVKICHRNYFQGELHQSTQAFRMDNCQGLDHQEKYCFLSTIPCFTTGLLLLFSREIKFYTVTNFLWPSMANGRNIHQNQWPVKYLNKQVQQDYRIIKLRDMVRNG
ncbi:hypothetical protein RHD99_16835 [Buttiauxella selenatireducens]|uniref:Uncharacterized protein n=1 Tax=Buttiauxella selenatireducens TaxID=3073902 RepID=A0ABY9S6X7_9ENTR|nr:hypothetical protein [Buttiauxella sp. R73]WMY73119.1 hypothetical protein RHD99_16835 [Buttiauxella sp. R73]